MKTTASRASAVSQTRGFGDLLYDKAGSRPSLDLDFAGTGSLRDKITGEHLVDHTRASTGTYIDSEGLVKQSTKNHFPYSEDLTQWITTISNGQVTKTFDSNSDNPYGSGGATKITCTRVVASNAAWLRSQAVNVGTAGIVTVSAWLKAATPSDVGKMVSVWMFDGGFKFHQQINLTSDWVRYSFTSTSTDGNIGEPANFGLVASNFQVDGVSNLETSVSFYIWGAQLETGSTATEYVKTTGAANSAPRFTHERVETGNQLASSNHFNLLASNQSSLRYATVALNGGGNTDSTFEPYAALSPDGKYNAAKLTFNYAYTSGDQSFAFTVNQPSVTKKCVFSFYAKTISGTATIRIKMGSNTTTAGGGDFTVTDQWQRFERSGVASANRTYFGISNHLSSQVGTSILIWGFQLEEEQDSATTYAPSIDTFTSRASNATYVDSAGLIKTAHRNLLRHSETLSNGVWIKSSFSHVANETTTAPDGSTVPWSDLGSYVYQDGTVTGAGTFTNSVYLKAETPCTVHLRKTDNDNSNVPCNVTTEWQRFTTTGTKTGGGGPTYTRLLIDNRQNTTANTVKIAIWGAQQVKGTEAGDYAKTEATSTGAARYSHDPETLTPTGLYLEPAATNLAAHSNNFNTWTKHTTTTVTLANTETLSPDGVYNAWKLTKPANQNYPSIYKTHSTNSGNPHTFSLFAKAGSLDKLGLEIRGTSVVPQAFFDLTNGTVQSGTGQIEKYPNGWYRCSVTITTDSSEVLIIRGGDGPNQPGTIYIFGAQLEVGSFASSYIPTDTSTVTRAADVYTSTANLTETFEPRGLLIEEARTNIVPYSEDFSQSDWNKEYATVTAGYTSPRGDNTAYKLISNTGGTSSSRLRWTFTSSTATSYTCSMFVKPDGLRYLHLRVGAGSGVNDNFGHGFDLQEGIAVPGVRDGTFSMSSTAHSIEKLPNGWFRVSVTGNAGNGARHLMPYLSNSATTTTFTGNGTDGIIMWGIQLELNSFPTSYIPTSGSSVTRSADIASISGDNFGTYRTNLLTHSNLNRAITGSGSLGSGYENLTLINFYGLSPSGKYDSTKLVPNDVNSGVKRIQWSGFTSGNQTTKTLSFYAKAAGHNFVHGRVNTTGVCFNLSNGTISIGFRDGTNQGTAAASSSMEDVGNGWYRCIMTSNIATNFTHIYVSNSSTTTTTIGNGTDGIEIYGIQIEEGSTATNYIPSTDTFTSRLGNATYVDSNGLIKTAYKNYLNYSEELNNAYWSRSQMALTVNAGIAPDGTNTADKVIPNTTSNATKYIYRQINPGGTLSIYAKADGYNYISLVSQLTGQSSGASLAAGVSVNLTDGSIQSIKDGTAEVIDVGNGWYRITLSRTDNRTQVYYLIQPHDGIEAPNHNGHFRRTFAGDGTSGVLIWGAMQTDSLLDAGEYTANTTVASGAPRYSHDPETLVPTGLYLEPAATNSWISSNLNSSHTDTYTNNIPGGYTYNLRITPNATTAPDGTETAALVVPREDVGSGQQHWLQRSHGQTLSTFSVFLKYNGWRYVSARNGHSGNSTVLVDLLNGTIVGVSSNTIVGNYKIEAYPNGWYRVSSTLAAANNGWSSIVFFENATIPTNTTVPSHTSTPDGVSGVYVWGLQVETTLYPTSVIITNGTNVTRAADTYTSTATTVLDRDGGNKEAFFTPISANSFYVKGTSNLTSSAYPRIFSTGLGNTENWHVYFNHPYAGKLTSHFAIQAGNSGMTSTNAIADGDKYIGAAYVDSGSSNIALNGTLGSAINMDLLNFPNDNRQPTAMRIGDRTALTREYNGTFNRLTFWKTRLPDASLINITNT